MTTKSKSAGAVKPHCVFDKKTGKKVACFKTIGKARTHMKTLAGAPKKSPGCGCSG